MRERLAEPDSRIERQRHWINAATYGSSILLSKEFAHFPHHILIMWRFLHGARRPLHVHDDESGPTLCHQRQHRVIRAAAAHIVHNLCSSREGRFRHFRL